MATIRLTNWQQAAISELVEAAAKGAQGATRQGLETLLAQVNRAESVTLTLAQPPKVSGQLQGVGINRQFCCVCLSSTDQYTTLAIDRRTPAEISADKPAVVGSFHYCMRPSCQAQYAQEAA